MQWGVPLIIHCIDLAFGPSAEHQGIDNLIMSVGACQVQWGVLSTVHCVDVRPAVQKKELDTQKRGGGGTGRGRREGGKGDWEVRHYDRKNRTQNIRSTHHGFLHALLTGKVQGSGAIVVRVIDQRTMLHQNVYHFSIA